MATLQVEIRFETSEDVSFLASNLHADKDDVITFFVTTRPDPKGRIKPGEKERLEPIAADPKANFTLRFLQSRTPFNGAVLHSDPKTGQAEAIVTTTEHGPFHYQFDGTAYVQGKRVHVAVKGCPEIIIR